MEALPLPRLLRLGALSVAALLMSACGTIQSVAEAPGKVTGAVLPGGRKAELRPLTDLHPAVLRYADSCSAGLRAASDDFARTMGTPEARLQAVEWRLRGSRMIFNAATGPVPLENMLDLLLLTIGGRVLVKEKWMSSQWGEAARPVVTAFGDLEARGWSILDEFYAPDQIAKLRAVAQEWEERQAGKGADLVGKLPNFREALKELRGDDGTSGGLLGFIQLDPLAGLEPAAREIALSRQFAERMLFWGQRMPILIEDEVQIAVLRAQELPEVVGVLADVARVSAAADTLATTAAGLPPQISAEREAALKQAGAELSALSDSTLQKVSAELTAQREGLVRDLETAQAPLQSLLSESRSTFQAAQGMSTEMAEVLRVLDAFIGRFQKPKEEPAVPLAEPEPPGKPFDISEYGAAAERIGVAAGELRQLVATLDASLPQVEQMVDSAATRGEAAVDHAFRRGLQLGLALVAAAAVAVLLVRLIGSRLARKAA